jgi:hypothetical protein
MEKMRIVKDFDGIEHIIIDREDGSQLSMPKSIYDAVQAEQSTPMVTDADKS